MQFPNLMFDFFQNSRSNFVRPRNFIYFNLYNLEEQEEEEQEEK